MKHIIIMFLLLGAISCKKANKNTEEAERIKVAGNKFKVNFGGDFVFELNYQSNKQMTWTPLTGEEKQPHTEDITMTEIRPNIYMIYWKEKSGNRVVHVEDFANGKAYTNIASADGSFYNLNGPLTAMGDEPANVGKLNVPTKASDADKIKVVGNKFKVNFGGDFVYKLDFHAANSMTWSALKGEDKTLHTEDITMTEIRPNVYMIYWTEASGNRVVHIEDYAKGKAYTNITTPDQTFYNLNGPLTLLEEGLSNKEKVIGFLAGFNDKTGTGADQVRDINPNKYIQHNLGVGDGMAGFDALMANKPKDGFKSDNIRAFQDGNYVFTHTIFDFFGSKVGFDVFRFEDGLIVEHWDNLTDVTPPNPSGRTQTDGPTESKDLNKTKSNKALVKDFVTTILKNGEMDKIGNFFDGDNYIQHNSVIADGLSGLGVALEGMAKQGISMVYTTIHKVLGEGDFVLVISEGTFGGKPTSYYDLFRVDNGKIAEHWDTTEVITPKSKRKNNNGKFNF